MIDLGPATACRSEGYGWIDGRDGFSDAAKESLFLVVFPRVGLPRNSLL
jgi:hypothetical protein